MAVDLASDQSQTMCGQFVTSLPQIVLPYHQNQGGRSLRSCRLMGWAEITVCPMSCRYRRPAGPAGRNVGPYRRRHATVPQHTRSFAESYTAPTAQPDALATPLL